MLGEVDDFRDLVDAHVRRFNDGVRNGAWRAFGEGFTPGARVTFGGLPVPPLVGREAIVAGYAASPPDDTISVRSISVEGDTVVVDYAWDARPDESGGTMTARVVDGRINNLQVTVC